MCGIAGFVSRVEGADASSQSERAAVLDRMCRRIAHRGPDDQGTMVEGAAALGMRRLSIIDLAGGHQPMSGCDPRVSIVFNGEIYNYRELRRELESRGHRFHTNSDTEAIIHAYEEFGADCVERLRGMFAFAVWDAGRHALFVARDRAGKKPLFYTVTREGTFVFGSELKSLLEHPGVKLPPGCHLTFADGRARVHQYWDFPFEPDETRSEEEWLEELRAALDEAVRVRLVADVPLGAFLSGGVDSSAVVGMMARASDRPVKTFSIGFREDSYDELKYARVAAKAFGTEHHEFVVTPDVCALVDELVWHLDEPFADSSALPTYMVSKMARAHVTVALSGDGGDELFAGYTRYAVERRRAGFARLPRLVREGLMRPLGRRLPHGAWGRNFVHNVALDPFDRYVEEVSVFTRLNKPSLYTEEFRRTLGGTDATARFREYAARVSTGEPLDSLLYLDSKTYLPGDILTKVDRMSMAASLEARTPLLDHKLIELVGRIPARLKMRGPETKHLFKRAVAGLVPEEILHRPKQGFGVPIQQWINQELRSRMRETLSDARTRARGYTDTAYVSLLLDEHERGRRDHAMELWALFVMELWHRAFVDAKPSATSREGFAAPEPVAV
ncbi:MAG: asparagine synthase (glutamine-hydrolyzing) [Acidobacteria bacterium]|nr:MAG: asparagine synthase (glutamine-hydrolyzing) [Acidobacteriota bacterium]